VLLVVLLVPLWVVSAPAAGRGRLTTERFWSRALGRPARMIVYTPPGYRHDGRRLPVAYFLHGEPGRPENLLALGLAARLDALIASGRIPPLVAVLPADDPAADTEWSDSAVDANERWERFLDHDVLLRVQRRYRTSGSRSLRAAVGLSMGAYGAVNLALRNRGTYGVVSAWSGYFLSNTPSVFPSGSEAWQAHSPLVYVRRLRPTLARSSPRISFYVGSRDGFLAENLRFDRLLRRLHVPHRFRVVPGYGHQTALWGAELDDELTFVGDAFRAGGA
jgi:enterochelin esterase-like enzyme